MLKHALSFVFAGSLLISSTVYAHSEKLRVELADRVVEGLIDHSKSEGPNPVVVIVAGDDAEIGDRLYLKIAEGAVAAGFVAIRVRGRDAEELGTIVNDMIGSRMMKQYGVDPTKVALIAKGSGAKIAMLPASGGTGEKVKASLLLNPACDAAADSFSKTYAPFLAGKSPRMIIAARGAACPLSQIYSAGKDFGEDMTVFTTAGDSMFANGKNVANQDAAVAATVLWLKNREWVDASAAKLSKRKKADAKKHAHDAHSAGTHP